MKTSRRGRLGEWIALIWLVGHGYRPRHRNWVGAAGELDLVVEQGRTIVFVEVKSRTQATFGGPEAAVNKPKQRKIIRAAQAYLSRYRLWDRPCRLDVVTVLFGRRRLFFRIRHLKNAFQTDQGRLM